MNTLKPHTMARPLIFSLVAAVALAALAASRPAAAQVVYFKKPPSVDEMLEVLAPPKTRGIQRTRSPGEAKQPEAGAAIALPITFDLGSAKLSRESTAYIEAVANLLKRDPSLSLVVEGHTDSVGNAKTNMLLSWERAMSVYRVIVERFGIDPIRLHPSGKGSTEALPDIAPDDAANRRVQFRISG
jgi:outer membrane protein OmpA-like peptidoglycan-associated protein